MTADWATLPLLPLRCVLEYLDMESALDATSTCRHWRQAMLLFEAERVLLTLKVNDLDKSLFLTRVFRKHLKKLHVYINCEEDPLEKFLTFVLPQFLDSHELEEVVFIGPIYILQDPVLQFTKLKRIITESLVFKHSHFMQKLAFIGCDMSAVNDEADSFEHKRLAYYSKPLSFSCVPSPADAVLSRSNVGMMRFSALKNIVFEYELISTEALETLSHLSNLSVVSLNVIFRRKMTLPAIDWQRVNSSFGEGLNVAINIISLPERRFKSIIENVFVEDMPLTSLKVMFCKTLYIPLISHVCCLYNTTLRELVWADCPYEGAEYARTIRSTSDQPLLAEVYNQVNPFVLLCWQCVKLRRLVIHGYWVWHYDVVGFKRLRKQLQLEVSSLYQQQQRFGAARGGGAALRVMHYDKGGNQKNSKFTDNRCRPCPWPCVHDGLRLSSSPELKAEYIVEEVLKPHGVT